MYSRSVSGSVIQKALDSTSRSNYLVYDLDGKIYYICVHEDIVEPKIVHSRLSSRSVYSSVIQWTLDSTSRSNYQV